MKKFLAAAALCTFTFPVWAAPMTVVLSVPSMNCPVCPITVKKSLTKVPGVNLAKIDLEKRQATVNFDDAKTSVEALTSATNAAGYPSTLAAKAQ